MEVSAAVSVTSVVLNVVLALQEVLGQGEKSPGKTWQNTFAECRMPGLPHKLRVVGKSEGRPVSILRRQCVLRVLSLLNRKGHVSFSRSPEKMSGFGLHRSKLLAGNLRQANGPEGQIKSNGSSN